MTTTVSKYNFPEIVSRRHQLKTWLSTGFFILLFGSLTLCIYLLPAAFALDAMPGLNSGHIALLVVSYMVLLLISYRIIRYVRRSRKKAIIQIRVNELGLHYDKADGTVDSILFSKLGKSQNPYFGDIHTRSTRYALYFKAIVEGRLLTVNFHTDLAYGYTGNQRQLRNHFIKGIEIFRPDLKISPQVYTDFFIDKETHDFDKKGYYKTIIAVAILIILLFVAIDGYIWYRFGESLLF